MEEKVSGRTRYVGKSKVLCSRKKGTRMPDPLLESDSRGARSGSGRGVGRQDETRREWEWEWEQASEI